MNSLLFLFFVLCFELYYSMMLFVFLHKLFHLWQLGVLSHGSFVSLAYPILLSFEHFLNFGHNKMLQDHPIYSLPCPWSRPFLQGSVVPLLEEIKIQTLSMIIKNLLFNKVNTFYPRIKGKVKFGLYNMNIFNTCKN